MIDSGLSFKELKRRMALAGLEPSRLSAVLVSHEHRDHISGVGPAARSLKIPVYINPSTSRHASRIIGPVSARNLQTGRDLELGPLRIHPFSLSHDAADPVGFILEYDGVRLGLATDLGTTTALVREHLSGCRALIVEANHDYDRLMDGPYPWHLKQRVRGRRGHLSNEDSAELLSVVSHGGLSQVVLAHLSEVNNLPELALECVAQVWSNSGPTLTCARQDAPSPVFDI